MLRGYSSNVKYSRYYSFRNYSLPLKKKPLRPEDHDCCSQLQWLLGKETSTMDMR